MFGLSALATKLIAGGLVLLALAGLIFGAVKHFEAIGERNAKAEQAAADALWMKGAVENMDKVQAYYRPYVDALAKAENNRAALRQEIDTKSAANNERACLDRSAVMRLRSLGKIPVKGGDLPSALSR